MVGDDVHPVEILRIVELLETGKRLADQLLLVVGGDEHDEACRRSSGNRGAVSVATDRAPGGDGEHPEVGRRRADGELTEENSPPRDPLQRVQSCHGGFPAAMISSSWILSLKVSMFCQKPS